uniref:Protein transport protein sec16 n=1 Tax=Cyprinus carpio TaxID=7962 RepID=A0A8C1TUV2_CYPCA
MQPPPRTAPPGASGPPPPSGGPNAFRRTRPHKHGAAAAMTPAAPSTQPVTDPFAFGRQSFLPMAGGSQAPLTNSNPLPMQGPPLPGFNPMIPPQGTTPGAAQADSPGPPPRIFTPQPVPLGPTPSSNPLPAEPGYFNSQEPMAYIAQLPNPAPSFSSSSSNPPSTGPTPPVQSQTPFQSQPTPPLPSHWVPDHRSRPPSVQNYFQPTSDLPSQPFQAQAPPPLPSPHTARPVTQSQNQGQSAQPNVTGPAATHGSHFPAQNYFSQSGGPSEPWFNQNPQDPSQRACPVSYSEVPSDSGTISMFFRGNDVENEETLSGEGRVNGIQHPFHSTTEFSGPYLNDTGNIRAGAGPCDSVENQECVPNQEVLPSEPPPGHSFEGVPNLETPDTGPRLARSSSVSSSYSNVSHSSGHGPHSGSHIPRRQQGVVGTFIQQESPRPPDHPPLHPSTGGYFEQIDCNPAAEASPTFPTPSPPKPVGVFQASANSSFEPVRSHGVGVRPAEVDRARVVMEKGGRDMQPVNLEQPPDNLETIYLPERRPSSRAQGARRPIESPATTLWAQNDTASLGANILLAPAAPSLAATFVPAHPLEVIQPPEDGPLDLHPTKPDPQPPSENMEIPPDSTPQASLGYASLLVTSPPVEALNQPVLIAPPSSLVSSQNLSQPSNQTSPRETATPVHPPPQSSEINQITSSTQGILNLAQETKDVQPSVQAPRPVLSRAQSLRSDNQYLPPSVSQAQTSAPATSHNESSNYELLDFSMHQPQSMNQAVPAVSQSAHPAGLVNNTHGFYLQVTKDAQQGGQSDSEPLPLQQISNPPRPSSNQPNNDPTHTSYPAHPPPAQHQPPPQFPPAQSGAPPGSGFASYPPQSGNSAPQPLQELQRPSSSLGGQSGYGAPPAMPPGPGYAGYYPGPYPEYQNGRLPYPPQYPMDPRSQIFMVASRKEGYDDPWRYYPGYDSSFDDECRRRDPYVDDFDRRSVHSEHSRSQQSQVYRSQPDLVNAAYDATGMTFPADYTYSQYPNPSDTVDYSQIPYSTDNTWTAPEQPPPRPLTPEKFSVPHRCARFGPAGQLILVQPNLPSAGQPTLVEIHSMETILQDSPEQSEMRSFPGPLVKEETHKVDVIKFAQNKAQECLRNDDLIDKDSAYLIWEFIVLLCRQNGTVVGTDIADLLLKEHRSVWLPGKSPNEANLIDFNNEAIEHAEEEEAGPISLLSDTLMGVPENVGKETERFRELLLFGRKKDALESAMKNGLWGHALLLASKMDNRTHARVMTRFANSLPINDPLQTVYQLMSGRMPAAATCCGDEKWGDWRPHLAMMLSNLTHTLDLDTRTISTMGDTLASKGLVDAAHFCYLMAQVGFGVYTKKSTKMVLIGSNHSLPFLKFCSSEAIQRTESYEYAQSLCSQPLSLPNFQVFKFIYACRLAEAGLCAQAFHYCEVISRTLLSLPEYYSAVFISQLIQMSLRLRFFDPQLKERPEQELFIEPDWLLHLRQLDGQIKVCDGAVPLQQAPPQGESVPFYPIAPGPPQPNFAAPFHPEMHEQYMPMPPQQIPQQMPHQMPLQFPTYSPAEMPPQMPPGMPPQMPPPMPGAEHGSIPSSPQQFPQSSPTFTAPPPQGKDFYEMARMGASGGWLTWLYPKRKNEAHLPDDKNKSIVWDEKKQKWVNLDEPEEESKPPPPPPTGFPKAPMGGMVPPGVGGPAGGPPVNMFSRRAGTKSRYVDVLNPGRRGSKPAAVVPPPADLFAPLAPMAMPANLFTPAAGVYLCISVFCISVYVCVKSNTLSRSSSMSSLSREVSQHLNQVLSAGSYLKYICIVKHIHTCCLHASNITQL